MVIKSYTLTVKETEIHLHCTEYGGQKFNVSIPIGPDLPAYYDNAEKCSKSLASTYLWTLGVEFNPGFKEAVEKDIYNAIKKYYTEA